MFNSNRQLFEVEAVAKKDKHLEKLLLEAIRVAGSEIRGQIAELSANLDKASRKERSGIIDQWQISNRGEVLELSGIMSRVAREDQHKKIQELVLHSLYFPQLRDRHARIVEAHPATFDWIFKHNSRRGMPWADFVHWLSNCDGGKPLYWLTGKPGSGKSTLMRYLYNHTLTKHYLGQWAGTKPLITASCFFWNPGADLQKSQVGLLRTLLFELLQQIPALIKSVNPWRWQSYELGSSKLVPWTIRELKDGFQNFLEETQDSVKVCLFVDGLDEFEGDDTARNEIITLFKSASFYPNVKVCVSSRPWLIFEDAFKSRPSLLLQDLTHNDIHKYVQSELVDNERFIKLKSREPESCAELAANIVDKAQGVCLWVRLVVMDLLQGLRNEDRLGDLRRRLEAMPVDLEEYFAQMMSTLDKFYLEQAFQLFQVAVAASHEISLMTFSFLHEEDPDYAINAPVAPITKTEVHARYESTKRRLNSRCMGLLEVHDSTNEALLLSPTVGFLHRTVRDFLRTNVLKEMIGSFRYKTFDVNLELCKSLLAQIKFLTSTSTDKQTFLELLDSFFMYAHRFEQDKGRSPTALLDDLDQTAWRLYGAYVSPHDHWTNHVHVENLTYRWRYDTGWGNTFASFTLVYGLHFYFMEKFQADPQMLANKRRRPLLDYVLRPNAGEPAASFVIPNLDLVELLLTQEANPNQDFQQCTTWSHFLIYLYIHQDEIKKSKRIELCSEAVRLLIRHGAKAGLQDFEKPGDGGRWCRNKIWPLPLEILQEVFDESEFQTMKDMLRVKRPPNNSRGHRFIVNARRFFTQTHQGVNCDDH